MTEGTTKHSDCPSKERNTEILCWESWDNFDSIHGMPVKKLWVQHFNWEVFDMGHTLDFQRLFHMSFSPSHMANTDFNHNTIILDEDMILEIWTG